MSLRAYVGCICLALAACGDADEPTLGEPVRFPVPGCEAFDPTPCDVREPACHVRLFGMASCLRGNVPGSLPPVSVISEDEYAEYLSGVYAELEPRPDPDHRERALVLLDLAVEGALQPETRIAEGADFAYGVYRWEPDDILIIDHGDHRDDFASAVLVHEFVHALQDRDVDLEAFEEEFGESYDSYLAVDAVVEGEAELHQARYAASMLGLDPASIDWTEHFQSGLDRAAVEMLEEESPYTASWYRFPYRWGGRYMHFTWLAGGNAALANRFMAPPATTQVLMASSNDAIEPQFTPTAPPRAERARWANVEDTVLGAWTVFVLLARADKSIDLAAELALGWRGDLLSVLASEPIDAATSDTAIVWRIDFEDEGTALEVASALGEGAGNEGAQVVLERSTER